MQQPTQLCINIELTFVNFLIHMFILWAWFPYSLHYSNLLFTTVEKESFCGGTIQMPQLKCYKHRIHILVQADAVVVSVDTKLMYIPYVKKLGLPRPVIPRTQRMQLILPIQPIAPLKLMKLMKPKRIVQFLLLLLIFSKISHKKLILPSLIAQFLQNLFQKQ